MRRSRSVHHGNRVVAFDEFKSDNRRVAAGDQRASRLWHPVATRLGSRVEDRKGTPDPRPALLSLMHNSAA